MTYSAALDPNAPGQAETASLGAQRIRALTLALQERLASLVVDPNADPLVLKADSINASQILTNSIGASELADGAVDTAAILDAAITNAKVKDGELTAGKMAPGALSLRVDYTFAGVLGGVLAAGATTSAAPQSYGTGSGIADGATGYATISTGASLTDAERASLALSCWFTGGNVNLAIKNTSGAGITLTGVVFKVSSHKS